MVATTASSTIVKPRLIGGRRRPRSAGGSCSGAISSDGRPPPARVVDRRAGHLDRLEGQVARPGAMPRSVTSAMARVPVRSGEAGSSSTTACRSMCRRPAPLSLPRIGFARRPRRRRDRSAPRTCRRGSPPRTSRARGSAAAGPTASARYAGSKSRRTGVPSPTATRAELDADAARPSEGASAFLLCGTCSLRLTGAAHLATAARRVAAGRCRSEPLAGRESWRPAAGWRLPRRRRRALPGGWTRPGWHCSNGPWSRCGFSTRGRALIRDVGVGADVDGHQVLFGHVGDPDDVRRQRQDEVRRLASGLDVREDAPDHGDVADERDGLVVRSSCPVRYSPARKFVSPSLQADVRRRSCACR